MQLNENKYFRDILEKEQKSEFVIANELQNPDRQKAFTFSFDDISLDITRQLISSEQFAKLTGAKVDVTHTPAGDLYAKAMVPFQAGQAPYDIVFGFSNFINDWRRYLEPVPKKYVEMKQMQDVTPSHIGIASWDGVMYQFPVDGDRHYLKYKKRRN